MINGQTIQPSTFQKYFIWQKYLGQNLTQNHLGVPLLKKKKKKKCEVSLCNEAYSVVEQALQETYLNVTFVNLAPTK